jgi:hypothetical protein
VLRTTLDNIQSRELRQVGLQRCAGAASAGADNAKFRQLDGAEIPHRSTFVFQQERGAWKIVQWHVSIGVANEEAVGQALTTQ